VGEHNEGRTWAGVRLERRMLLSRLRRSDGSTTWECTFLETLLQGQPRAWTWSSKDARG
jgi:hypothetical protein